MNRLALLRLRPPRIAMGLVLAAIAVQVAVPISAHPALPATGLAFVLGGFGVMLRAWWLFRLAGTAVCPTDTATALITSDVFAVSRNPMYLGITMMLAGLALGTGSLALYFAGGAYFLVMDRVFCPFEERKSAQEFGDAYAAYRRRVRRWL